ncbi:hypothetical protein BDV38DRAFT_279619 [Aspergillus pseudotamarii]|uniref:Tubby C-terminal-like domain-containing protein n=1 Tax=Aspergillus pseudotamarii TaxID=132259 RepID=A0A5N6T4J2_ASPPS|nr:uncharacterized protein BDV38DRAFT_279619 [Aspergillus pseudotamarii]KAE8141179.1 hypothetical protein BDV38DRAFT_279619 [Aspergillus pseudotamarii]
MDQPVQLLSYQRLKSKSTFIISLQHGNGTATPIYEVACLSSNPNLSISRLQPTYQQQQPPPQYGYPPAPHPYYQQYQPYPPQQYSINNPPPPTKTTIGTVALSSMSSKITISIHNISELKMKRPGFLASGHRFTHPRYGTLEWKESDLFEKRFKLVDSNKTVLARFDKWKLPEQQQQSKSSIWGSSSSSSLSKKKKAWAFQIFINADPELLDWIVVSGLGVVEYRITSDKEWEEELLGNDDVWPALLG